MVGGFWGSEWESGLLCGMWLEWEAFLVVGLNAADAWGEYPPCDPPVQCKCGGGKRERGCRRRKGWRDAGIAGPPVSGHHSPARRSR